MTNYTFLLTNLFPVICFEYVITGKLILFIASITIVLAFVGKYFLKAQYKENFAIQSNQLKHRIHSLEHDMEDQKKVTSDIQSKLDGVEKMRSDFEVQNKILILEIKDLSEQILKYKEAGRTEKKDIVIEYYLNKKSPD
ncbi:MAG: hypothetical protein WCI54_07595 [Bacteroidia bacterium]|jgi:hypothetical protein